MKNQKNEPSKILNNESGMTLIELMIVVAILGLIGGLVGLNVSRKLEEARGETTKNQIRQLGLSLDDFKRQCGSYPTTAEGLDALINKDLAPNCRKYDPEGYIKGGKIPRDGWDREFVYSAESGKYELKSLGPDADPQNSSDDLSSNNLE